MSTHNISFYGELVKIILQLSPNTHLICSTVNSGFSEGNLERMRKVREFQNFPKIVMVKSQGKVSGKRGDFEMKIG